MIGGIVWAVLLQAASLTPPPVVAPSPRPGSPMGDFSAMVEQVLRRQGMSPQGARAVAHDTSDRDLLAERREADLALAGRMAALATAPVIDVAATADVMRQRDVLASSFSKRQTDTAIKRLAGLSPADRRVYAKLLVRTRSGFIPFAPPAPPAPPPPALR